MTAPVPDTLEEMLSPAWLTAALEPRFPGIVVTAVEPGPVVSRITTNARFRIECRGGVPEGLSPYLCGKGYFNEVGKVSREAGEPEAYFYRDLASATGVRTLRSVYADVDPTTRHGVVVTEDVLVHGATFLDARSDYTPDLAAEGLEQLATLHAATWGDAALAGVTWLRSRLERTTQARGVAEIRGNFEGPIGVGVPEKVRNAERLFEAYCALAAETATTTPWSVIHGDAHVGNLFLDADHRPTFVDWQLVQRGPWYIDVGYHVASTLTVEDRRRREADLVRLYLENLAARGIDPPKSDEAWAGIRRGILHGFYLWGITVYVDPTITATLLERLGTAAADHDAFDAVAEPLRP
jgi:hypothetical protein